MFSICSRSARRTLPENLGNDYLFTEWEKVIVNNLLEIQNMYFSCFLQLFLLVVCMLKVKQFKYSFRAKGKSNSITRKRQIANPSRHANFC